MLRKILPDIDCGACGAPSCEALAADIVRDDASLNNCIFMQARFEKEGSLEVAEAIDLMERVWGKDRFINKENSNRNRIMTVREIAEKLNLKVFQVLPVWTGK